MIKTKSPKKVLKVRIKGNSRRSISYKYYLSNMFEVKQVGMSTILTDHFRYFSKTFNVYTIEKYYQNNVDSERVI